MNEESLASTTLGGHEFRKKKKEKEVVY